MLSTVALAQPLERPKFELASVKPSKEQGVMAVQDTPGGRLVANAPVKFLLMNAFALQRSEIIGGPDWINETKATNNSSRDQLMQMLQSLLEDRFRLIVHREIRETPACELTVAKRGAKFMAADGRKCATDISAARCGKMRISGSAPGVLMEGNAVPVSELVRVLAVSLDQAGILRRGSGWFPTGISGYPCVHRASRATRPQVGGC